MVRESVDFIRNWCDDAYLKALSEDRFPIPKIMLDRFRILRDYSLELEKKLEQVRQVLA